ncbi:MAG TPA: hypothetical protein VGY53_01495, partial [Isosphaeraceae bacterium]|nr:hypothetical protein [Isosphaeraceae bacterium]
MTEAVATKPAARASTSPPLARRAAWVADLALVLAFFTLTFLLGVFPLKDTDFWWHLRTGDLIRHTGRIPTHDWYTYSVPDHPWIDLHWGFEVALSWGYAHFGVVGLNLAKCAITCVAVGLLISARKRDWPLWVMLLAWLPALYVLGGRMYVRPETCSLLYLATFLAVLVRIDRRPALAFLLVPVQALWVNTQGLFVFGPLLMGMALVGAALQPEAFRAERLRWWRTLALATFLVGLA